MTHRLIGLLITLLLSTPLASVPAPPAGKISRIATVTIGVPVTQLLPEAESLPTGMRAFWGELGRLGYWEGQNFLLETWSAEGQPERLPELVDEVVRRNPDLILVFTTSLAPLFRAATTTIPIVAAIGDPMAADLVTNVARPGDNLTGMYVGAGTGMEAKRLALLKEALPGLSRVAVLGPSQAPGLGRLLDEGSRLGLTVRHVVMDGPFDEAHYVDAFQTMTQGQVQAVLVYNYLPHFANRQLVVALAARHGLAAIYAYRDYVEVGGFMAYGVANRDMLRRLAGYVARILQGAKPGDLPFEQATTFEFVINLKTAQALGLTIPPTLLFQMDEVIR